MSYEAPPSSALHDMVDGKQTEPNPKPQPQPEPEPQPQPQAEAPPEGIPTAAGAGRRAAADDSETGALIGGAQAALNTVASEADDAVDACRRAKICVCGMLDFLVVLILLILLIMVLVGSSGRTSCQTDTGIAILSDLGDLTMDLANSTSDMLIGDTSSCSDVASVAVVICCAVLLCGCAAFRSLVKQPKSQRLIGQEGLPCKDQTDEHASKEREEMHKEIKAIKKKGIKEDKLRDELNRLGKRRLKKRAAAAGASEEDIEAAAEKNTWKQDLIALVVKPDQDELRRAFDACDRADGELDGRIKVSSLHAVFVALGADPKRVTLEAVKKAVEEQADENKFELRAVRQPEGPLEYELEYEIFEKLMEGARARELFGDALKRQSTAATRVRSSAAAPPRCAQAISGPATSLLSVSRCSHPWSSKQGPRPQLTPACADRAVSVLPPHRIGFKQEGAREL